MLKLKRAYDPPSPTDGQRILVERLWPRGLTKSKAAIDLWMKDISPSPELRKWFAHDPKKWPEFRKRYLQELKANKPAVDSLRKIAKSTPRHPHLRRPRRTTQFRPRAETIPQNVGADLCVRPLFFAGASLHVAQPPPAVFDRRSKSYFPSPSGEARGWRDCPRAASMRGNTSN